MKCCIVFISLFVSHLLIAQTRNFRLVKNPTANPTSQQRKAVVIGMSEYGQGRALSNTVNDATDMAASLEKLGFEVTLLKNNDLKNLKSNLSNWYKTIEGNDMAVFYFAGHGMEVNGENYLVPVDADMSSETDVVYNTLNVNNVLGNMDEKKVGMKLIILDACRDNPFKRSWTRGAESKGLAQISAPRGTYIAFAASPGFTAQDGGNYHLENGVFTHYLKQEILKKGVSIDEVFNNVSGSVSDLTQNQQTPFKNSSLTKNFYFLPAGDGPSPSVPVADSKKQPAEDFKKYYYYVDQGGKESTNHFASREEAGAEMKSNQKYGRIYSNTGEVFTIDAPVAPAVTPTKPEPTTRSEVTPASNTKPIALSVLMPEKTAVLSESQVQKLTTKITQITSAAGLAATNYDNSFVLYPVFTLTDSRVVESGIKEITVVNCELTLFIKQADSKLLFASIGKSLRGSGNDKESAVSNAISQLNTGDADIKSFIETGKVKIISYYNGRCADILAESDRLAKMNSFEAALGKLLAVPQASTCYSKIGDASIEVYKQLQNARCAEYLKKAQAALAIGNFNASAEYLVKIDPSANCFAESQKLLPKIEAKADEEHRRKLDMMQEVYRDKVALERQRVDAIKEITTSYYQNQPKRITYNLFAF